MTSLIQDVVWMSCWTSWNFIYHNTSSSTTATTRKKNNKNVRVDGVWYTKSDVPLRMQLFSIQQNGWQRIKQKSSIAWKVLRLHFQSQYHSNCPHSIDFTSIDTDKKTPYTKWKMSLETEGDRSTIYRNTIFVWLLVQFNIENGRWTSFRKDRFNRGRFSSWIRSIFIQYRFFSRDHHKNAV